MSKKNNKTVPVSVIIPIHEFNDEVNALTLNAINSVIEQNLTPSHLCVVYPENITDISPLLKEINVKLKKKNIIFEAFVHNEDSNFCNQINIAVRNIKTEWFSILEFDDYYWNSWFENFDKYENFYTKKDDISIYIPINNMIDKEGNSLKLQNEIAWAMGYGAVEIDDDLGYLNLNKLKAYSEFQVNGSIINVNDFLEVGGLKPNIKTSFWNEFLMRMCEFKKIIYIIPKLGYIHLIGRENSLTNKYLETISEQEMIFWLEVAQKEYINKEDKEFVYIKK